MQPFLARLYKKKLDPATLAQQAGVTAMDMLNTLKDLPYDLKEIFRKIREGSLMVEFQHKGLESMMRTFISVSNKLSAAIIVASIIIGSSLLVFAGIPPFWNGVPLFGIIGFSCWFNWFLAIDYILFPAERYGKKGRQAK